MNGNIDFGALLNHAIIEAAEKENTESGRRTAAILKVFAKRGIDAFEAVKILLEIAAVNEAHRE